VVGAGAWARSQRRQAPVGGRGPGRGRRKEKGRKREERKGREKEKRKKEKGRKRKKRNKKKKKKRKMGKKERKKIGKRFRKLEKIVRKIGEGFLRDFTIFRASA
jgi:hypothetical protein